MVGLRLLTRHHPTSSATRPPLPSRNAESKHHARLVIRTANIGQGDACLEAGRIGGRSNLPRGLAFALQSPPPAGTSDDSKRRPQSTLADRAAAIDAGDDLLAQITAFGERDGFLVSADFLRQILIGDVQADDRKALFDADRLPSSHAASLAPSTPAAPARAGHRRRHRPQGESCEARLATPADHQRPAVPREVVIRERYALRPGEGPKHSRPRLERGTCRSVSDSMMPAACGPARITSPHSYFGRGTSGPRESNNGPGGREGSAPDRRPCAGPAISVPQKRIRDARSGRWRRQKRLASLAGLNLVELVRRQPIEELGPLAAGDLHLRRARGMEDSPADSRKARYSASQSPKSTATGPQGVSRRRAPQRFG